MIQYAGILDGSGDIWVIRTPDLPGFHGGGKTTEAATVDTVSVWCRPLQPRFGGKGGGGRPDAGGPDGARTDQALAAALG
jgi:hypothetical protein